ncbi:ribosomal protein S27E [Cenarchaeum symbiosum A]|uniref:Small ribosomal subunit protein eS27 n=1 Tax=Cenarchaeum symbiosum (strain A) TaxID=414004 RepID=A0RY94_CENSY|nr:ribosomal protein S27E [Cenarchaeum symbiosum A]
MAAASIQVPEPTSRFVKIECESCGSPTIVYSMAKSAVNCRFCGNLLAEPAGGKAVLFGKLQAIVDGLPKIEIRTVQKAAAKKPPVLLLDTMIIHRLLDGSSINEFKDGLTDKDITFILLDRILTETIHMEKHEYGAVLTSEEIVERLGKMATVEKRELNHAEDYMLDAKDLFESGRYVDAQGKPLSMTDCTLLKYAMKWDDMELVTQDRTLKDALAREQESAGA